MAAEDEELLPLRPIHRSLERRIMLKGGERELVMVAFIPVSYTHLTLPTKA